MKKNYTLLLVICMMFLISSVLFSCKGAEGVETTKNVSPTAFVKTPEVTSKPGNTNPASTAEPTQKPTAQSFDPDTKVTFDHQTESPTDVNSTSTARPTNNSTAGQTEQPTVNSKEPQTAKPTSNKPVIILPPVPLS